MYLPLISTYPKSAPLPLYRLRKPEPATGTYLNGLARNITGLDNQSQCISVKPFANLVGAQMDPR